MSKIHRETVTERVTTELRQSILRGRLLQGTPVTEEAMAEQYGVSRPTLRQALNTLLLEGLLTRHPGTRVMEVTTLDHDDVRDIYRARRFLELGGIKAVATASAQQLEQLRLALQGLAKAVDADNLEAFIEADYDCHAAIVGFLGSRNLSEAHSLLMSKLRIAIAHVTVDKQDNLDSLKIHEEFTEKILAGRLEEAHQNLTQRLNESELTVLEKIGTVRH